VTQPEDGNPSVASWTLPRAVRAYASRRDGGVSLPPYDSLNLGLHVGDREDHVVENRRRFLQQLGGAQRIAWVNQVHGNAVALAEDIASGAPSPNADALVTSQAGVAIGILTADCLPVFFCSVDGGVIGLAHAGWRGLAAGVLENTIDVMRRQARERGESQTIIAAFGAAIGPSAFEVGAEVKDALCRAPMAGLMDAFFKPSARPGKFFANLYGVASLRLGLLDVMVTGPCKACTASQPAHYFSYRRDGQTGRQASAIWKI
jgi:polyphenol oxidase